MYTLLNSQLICESCSARVFWPDVGPTGAAELSITRNNPGRSFSFRRLVCERPRTSRYTRIPRKGQRHPFPTSIIYGANLSSARAESSLKLRLAIQFGPPVNHLKNRFLIGTLCNEQNVRPCRERLFLPPAFLVFPAFPFARSVLPSPPVPFPSYITARHSFNAAQLDDDRAKIASSANAHLEFQFFFPLEIGYIELVYISPHARETNLFFDKSVNVGISLTIEPRSQDIHRHKNIVIKHDTTKTSVLFKNEIWNLNESRIIYYDSKFWLQRKSSRFCNEIAEDNVRCTQDLNFKQILALTRYGWSRFFEISYFQSSRDLLFRRTYMYIYIAEVECKLKISSKSVLLESPKGFRSSIYTLQE